VSLQDVGVWFGILGGGGGLLGGVYAAIDSIRKRRKLSIDQAGMVTNSAIQLVKQVEERAGMLEQQLKNANQRADDLEQKLTTANTRAETLQHAHDQVAEQLTNAQAEIRVLRGQVKYLTAELDKRGNCPEMPGR
jgi:septal ring factor EnvC (AmiA/AmiB activator)